MVRSVAKVVSGESGSVTTSQLFTTKWDESENQLTQVLCQLLLNYNQKKLLSSDSKPDVSRAGRCYLSQMRLVKVQCWFVAYQICKSR
ncbi:hypothetical protein AFLA_012517 [Aspergillus flavus NRRL3357]|nr:hypothetical protein AFLA_012517 [Aspergillus flavus NRRL3357]